MLEEMGYAKSAEQEGKRIYTITEEGLRFLSDQSNIADGVRNRMKRSWNFQNAGKMAAAMKECLDLEILIGRAFYNIDEDRAERIRGILSETYGKINAVIRE
jgi:DNA-binding PadR family transcriptional regulator